MPRENEFLILVADDEEWVTLAMSKLLQANGYRVATAASGTEAREMIQQNIYDMVVVDLKMNDVDGIEILKAARTRSYDPEVLLITAHATVESAVEAIKLGAFDYLTKPLDSKRVLLTVKQALERRRLKTELSNLRKEVGDRYGRRHIIYAGSAMKKVLELVDLISRTDSTVLVEGESGTGKELVARAIHFDGARANKPFITVNCGALPEPLLESELFGHVKGAFTGALSEKRGLFEEADEGTILLDEVGDLPLTLQVKLLRVLQDGEMRRVGGVSFQRVNVRLIASTNRRLHLLVEEGRFREDLFYRLNVIPITLPPLRERKEDIVPLVNHFVRELALKLGKDVKGISPLALTMLIAHDWPGNVRELENVVERTVALSSSELITPEELRVSFELGGTAITDQGSEPEGNPVRTAYRILEKEQIIKALEKNGWNRWPTADELGISRTSLWRKMKEYGLREPPGSVSDSKDK